MAKETAILSGWLNIIFTYHLFIDVYISDTSFGDYAVPMHIGAENSLLPPSRRYSDSDTSGDQNSDYMFLQVSALVPESLVLAC